MMMAAGLACASLENGWEVMRTPPEVKTPLVTNAAMAEVGAGLKWKVSLKGSYLVVDLAKRSSLTLANGSKGCGSM